MNKKEAKRMKGKVCWLYLNDKDLGRAAVNDAIFMNNNYSERLYKGKFKIKDVQCYDIESSDRHEYKQIVFYIHPLNCSAATIQLRFPDFCKLFQEFESDEDTIIFRLLAPMFLERN